VKAFPILILTYKKGYIMNLKQKTTLENIQFTKCINIEGLLGYIMENDTLFNNIKTFIHIEGLFTDEQISIEIRNIIHKHFTDIYVNDYKNDSFIDWIITDWIEHLLDVPYLIKELKTFECINE
jgi:predicted AAA+ superfamily ATPase